MESKVFSVSELNSLVKLLLEAEPALTNVAVTGELSNYKIYPSGHHYFTLKDENASLRCVMFRGQAAKLRFQPQNGMKVIAMGRVTVFPRDGAYQLYCSAITPEGVGDLYAAFEQLKAKLAQEGLFDRDRKKPLPRFPDRIAVITSGAGAAVRDIIRVLGARWPLAKVIVLPVRVQGAEAPPEIVGALRYANAHAIADLIITGRGGGSIEDLWAFNDERVARAIAASGIPVISAVGHEPDFTIADFVADLRAATPSNAAELAVPDRAELSDALDGMALRAAQAVRKELSERRRRLDNLCSRPVMAGPGAYIDSKRMELDYMRGRLAAAQERIVAAGRRGYVGLASKLDALSPLKVLGRGYSIAVSGDGTVLRSAEQAAVDDRIDLRLSKGALVCRVEEVFEEESNG